MECFLKFDAGVKLFAFKTSEAKGEVPLSEAGMQAALEHASGALHDVLVFLADNARKKPGVWMSASTEAVKAGQGTIEVKR